MLARMSFTEQLQADLDADIDAVAHQPFFAGLADGTLPPAVFVAFLEEDARCLEQQAAFFARLAARCEGTALFDPFVGLASALSMGALKGLYAHVLPQHGSSVERALSRTLEPFTDVYVRLLQSYAALGPVVEGVTAATTFLIHHEAGGDRLRARYPSLPDTPYGNWIREWGANPAFRGVLAELRRGVDAYVALRSPAEVNAARRVARVVSRFEVLYWDQFSGAGSGPFPSSLYAGGLLERHRAG